MHDFTYLSARNNVHPKKTVVVANQAEFIALDLSDAAVLEARDVLYIHINKNNRKCYVGITAMLAVDRWSGGHAYRFNRRFGNSIKKWGWDAFEHHILAFVDDRDGMNQAEIDAICAAGGHKSKFTYNLSPGGDAVAENDKPLVGIFLETGQEKIFKSGLEAARHIGLTSPDAAMSIARNERTSASGWWFRFIDDESATPPELWGEKLRTSRVRKAKERRLKAIKYDTGEERYYASVSKAAEAFGVHQSTISEVASGESRSANGWWFCFLDEKREMPNTFGAQTTREKRDRKVYAVNLESGERREFRNATVASDGLGLYDGAASGVLSGSRTSAAGWWFTYDLSEKPPTEYKGTLVAKYRSKAVIAEHIETGQVQYFDSAKLASEALKIQRSSISNIINGKRESAKGYTFRVNKSA
jgi:predicted XRE-type DNA-binding protein